MLDVKISKATRMIQDPAKAPNQATDHSSTGQIGLRSEFATHCRAKAAPTTPNAIRKKQLANSWAIFMTFSAFVPRKISRLGHVGRTAREATVKPENLRIYEKIIAGPIAVMSVNSSSRMAQLIF